MENLTYEQIIFAQIEKRLMEDLSRLVWGTFTTGFQPSYIIHIPIGERKTDVNNVQGPPQP